MGGEAGQRVARTPRLVPHRPLVMGPMYELGIRPAVLDAFVASSLPRAPRPRLVVLAARGHSAAALVPHLVQPPCAEPSADPAMRHYRGAAACTGHPSRGGRCRGCPRAPAPQLSGCAGPSRISGAAASREEAAGDRGRRGAYRGVGRSRAAWTRRIADLPATRDSRPPSFTRAAGGPAAGYGLPRTGSTRPLRPAGSALPDRRVRCRSASSVIAHPDQDRFAFSMASLPAVDCARDRVES